MSLSARWRTTAKVETLKYNQENDNLVSGE